MKNKAIISRVILSIFLANGLMQGAPLWWSSRQAFNSKLPADDFAVINQGQLKSLARKAYDELQSTYASGGGAGSELDLLVQSWNADVNADDFAAVTVGQVKSLSRKYYERLLSLGAISKMPNWLNVALGKDDFSAANIGQAKQAFSFEIPALVHQSSASSGHKFGALGSKPSMTAENDGIMDADEVRFGLNANSNDDENSSTSQGFLSDELGRLKQVLRVKPHVYVLDNEANVLSVNN